MEAFGGCPAFMPSLSNSFLSSLQYSTCLKWRWQRQCLSRSFPHLSLLSVAFRGKPQLSNSVWSGGIVSHGALPPSLDSLQGRACDLDGQNDRPGLGRFPSRANEDLPWFLMNRRARIVSAKYVSFYLWQSSWRVWLP